jgi:hypothetical protein
MYSGKIYRHFGGTSRVEKYKKEEANNNLCFVGLVLEPED